MNFMNRYEIEEAAWRFQGDTDARHPFIGQATRFLLDFMNEVDSHSDGWAYWGAPVKAANKLMRLVEYVRNNPDAFIEEQAFRRTLGPIKSFYTRRGNAAGMKFPEIA